MAIYKENAPPTRAGIYPIYPYSATLSCVSITNCVTEYSNTIAIPTINNLTIVLIYLNNFYKKIAGNNSSF
ncbi:MAG: hypothetical protein KAI71_00235 [Candidatus Pacebacteria bacterium]|nr:hypothetical protein [Candidatus Paceibacterota bacterium]